VRALCDWRQLATILLVTATTSACGSSLPARYVIEHDLGSYAFRRYQKSLEIEIPIHDNTATGHTAAYLRRTNQSEVTVITAFVTVYEHAKALAAEARAGLGTLAGYTLTTGELFGEHVWLLASGAKEHWCIWVSENRIVKIGAPVGSEFPQEIIDAYVDLYPSDLDEHGVAQEDALSTGPAKEEQADDGELAVPASLREGAPR
jgi:hypothetical protein